MASTASRPASQSTPSFIPREHGATAMLLIPFFSAAVLARRVRWPEFVVLIALVCAFAVKEPLLVMARQLVVWKQPHPETKAAKQWAAVELILLTVCGALLMLTESRLAFVLLGLGAVAFTLLAVFVNLKNRQRSEWFQVASAVALSATSVAVCLAVEGTVSAWCWLLWLLSSLQAAAGIFVVHARLDARIAARKGAGGAIHSRRAAYLSIGMLAIAGACFAYFRKYTIDAALLIATAGYLFEPRRQKNDASLRMPLQRVGQQALALSAVYALLIVIGLW